MWSRITATLRRIHRARDGQVMFFMLFGLLTLTGLVVFVYNSGDQVDWRVQAQIAADEGVWAGGVWLARGYNVLSTNNVAATKLLAVIANLETVWPPMEHSVKNLKEILGDEPSDRTRENLLTRLDDLRSLEGNYSSHGTEVGDPDTYLREGFEYLRDYCREAIDKLGGLDLVLADLDRDVGGFPEHFTAFPDGELWRCMRGLQDFNDAMVEITPVMAQRRTERVGRRNHAHGAFLTPVWPYFAVERGAWSDYRQPTEDGRPPNYHRQYRRGGYRTLMGYPNNVGPFKRYRDDVVGHIQVDAWPSGYHIFYHRLVHAKLEAIWNNQINAVWIPWWDTDYDRVVQKIREEGINCPLSAWVVTRRISSERFTNTSKGEPQGTPAVLQPLRTHYVISRTGRRARSNPGGFPPTDFRDQFHTVGGTPQRSWLRWNQHRRGPATREVLSGLFGRELSNADLARFDEAPPIIIRDRDGNVVQEIPRWFYYQWQKWAFVGAMLDENEASNEEIARLIGDKGGYYPWLLNWSRAGISHRYDYGVWEFIAFAWRTSRPRVWRNTYANPNPTGANLAYAQIRVHNPTSWDLFTQNWRVKLTPASDLLDVDPSGFVADLAQYNQYEADITEAHLEPVRALYDRMPAEDVVYEINNH